MLDAHHSDLVTTAETIARTIAATHAADVDLRARFPAEALKAIKAARLLALLIPYELGGLGGTAADVTAVSSILAGACASTGLVFAMHQVKVASLINSSIELPWHRQLLRRIADGQLLVGSATTEGGIGGDIRTSACAVTRIGARIAVDKLGAVISYGDEADVVLLTARRTPEAASSDQVLLALLRSDYRLEKTGGWDSLGMRGTCSNTYRITAEAGEEQICGKPFDAIIAQSMLPTAHLFWSGVWHGIAVDAVSRAQALVRMRARTRPESEPAGARRLAKALRNLQLQRAGILDALASFRRVETDPDLAEGSAFALAMSNLKVASSELAVSVVADAMQACGIAGYRNDGPHSLARHLRDAYSASVMINNDRIDDSLTALVPVARHDSSLLT